MQTLTPVNFVQSIFGSLEYHSEVESGVAFFAVIM